MDRARFERAADAALLDVDDPTGAELEGGGRIGRRPDRLVQAQIRPDLCLELRMLDQILVMERLFDHQQIEGVERAEHVQILEGVRGVRVDGQQDVRMVGSDRRDPVEVQTRRDLELDPPVTLGEVPIDLCAQLVDGLRDPDRHAADDLFLVRTQVRGE